MDYKKIMDGDVRDYTDFYENIINKIISDNSCTTSKIPSLTKEKRKLGLEKYKEHSFQNSFENSMKSPTLEHASEEMLDAINYLAHEVFVSRTLGNSSYMEDMLYILEGQINLYEIIISIQENRK